VIKSIIQTVQQAAMLMAEVGWIDQGAAKGM